MQKVKMRTIYTNDIDQENDATAAADVVIRHVMPRSGPHALHRL